MEKIVFKKDVTKGYDKHNIFIEKGCLVEKGAIIWRGCVIVNKSKVLTGAEILPFTFVNNSTVEAGSVIGPCAHLRPKSEIGKNCKVGNFVEIKNSIVGSGSKISHLTYVGDGEIGKDCNIGCGVVFCNYDGKDKHKTILRDRVFVGCNSNLVAPLVVENEGYIAAGTTVTKDVPSGALAIGRVRQENKEKYKNNKYIKDK